MIFKYKDFPFKDYVLSQFKTLDDAELFMTWAFGENFRTMVISSQAVINWNVRHGHLLPLVYNGEVTKDLPKMIDLYYTTDSLEHEKMTYDLYLKLVDILIGERIEIALKALSKCKVNLIMADNSLKESESYGSDKMPC